MDDLIKELSKIYSTTEFKKGIRDGNQIVLYNNEDLEWNEEFIDKAIELAQTYLVGNELDTFAIIFDYLGEIAMDDATEICGEANFLEEKGFEVNIESKTININIEEKCNNKYKRKSFFNNIFFNIKNNNDRLYLTEIKF